MDSFTKRQWARVETSDRAHWAAQYRRHGPEATMPVARALFARGKQLRDDFPGERYAHNDLKDHVRLKQLLQKAAHAFVTVR